MIFWVFAIAITVAVLVYILRPLLRAPVDEAESADYDIAVFKSQLREIERDLARGRVTAEEAEAARVEISRRLLAADKRRDSEEETGSLHSGYGRTGVMVASGLIVCGLGLGTYFYGLQGDPRNPDMPLILRQAELQLENIGAQIGQQENDLDEAADRLRARLESGQGEPEEWMMLGRAEVLRGNFRAGAEAYEQAVQFFPDDMELKSAYGEALVQWAEGRVTDQAYLVFNEVATNIPSDPRAQFYVALYDRQEGRYKDSLDRFVLLIQRAPEGAPWLSTVRTEAQSLADEMRLDLEALIAQAPVAAPVAAPGIGPVVAPGVEPGPTAEDIEAARNMSPEDRMAMIRGMVDGLSERLSKDPSDLQGWERLVRSLMVLGETERAQEALSDAHTAFEGNDQAQGALSRIALDLGLLPASADEDDRRAEIAGMVDQLAARLQDNQGDVEGWQMLGRSYGVLGRIEEASAAFDTASALEPDNVDILIEHARILRAAAAGRQTDRSLALMQRVQSLDADNTEALWFLGLNAVRQGQTETARDLLDQAIETLPEGTPDREALRAQADQILSGN